MSNPPAFELTAAEAAPYLPIGHGGRGDTRQDVRPAAGLCVRGEFDSLETITAYVLRIAAYAAVGEAAAMRLRLAVEELSANAIVHGYGRRCGWLVLLGIADGRGAAGVQLRDTAVAFDPSAVPRPTGLDKPVHQRPIGGLGVHLALTSVDEYHYQRAHGENRSTLVVRRREGET